MNEGFQFGITDPNFNNPSSADFLPGLLPFDLTRGGRLFRFNGRARIKQQAAFAQDAINFKDGLTVSLGLRFDNYDGLSRGKSLQMRVGVSYLFNATLTNPIRNCTSATRGATRVSIPADGAYNADTNPSRVAPRSLLDLSIGSDNLLRVDKMKVSARLTFVNLTNKVALYNFNSTFSGTHFVTPRVVQGQIGIVF